MKMPDVLLTEKSRSLLLLLVVVLFSLPAAAQSDKTKNTTPPRRIPLGERSRVSLADLNVEILTDARVIAMMAALNAAGFDFEPGNRSLSALRQQLRADIKNINPSLARRLHDHFVAHSKGRTDAAPVAPSLSLALTLTAPPTFSIDTAVDKLPEEVREIIDFALLLEEFYRDTKFGTLLPKYMQAYDQAAKAYAPLAANAIANVIQYLHTEPILELPPSYIPRIQPGAREAGVGAVATPNRIRRFVILPDLLNAANAANLRVVRDTYYIFLGAGVDPNDAVRRSYLRFVLDPIVEKHNREVREIGSELRKLAESRGEKLAPEYKNSNAYFQISDSLARAVDTRIESLETLLARRLPDDKAFSQALEEENERAIYELSLAYDRGAVLVYHFYEQIKQAENAGVDIQQYLPTLLQNIKFDLETARLNDFAQRIERYKASRQLAAKNAPTLAAAISNADQEIVTRLEAADQLVRAGQYEDARGILTAVLKQKANNARAYYGLAEIGSKIASRIEDRDKRDEELYASVQYYKDAADNASPETEKWLMQRSYVAAAKILDFLGQTSDAVAAYEMAVKLGDVPNGAYREAVNALKAKPEQKPKP